MNSALYVGQVQHLRLRPRRHHLRYRFFWLLLDLDELDQLSARCTLFSNNKFNLFGFYAADHLNGSGDLRGQIGALLAQAGLPVAGKIMVMSLPRILGHIFNPISLFFCYDANRRLTAMLYEVNNTFCQRHSYLFAAQDGRVISHSCHKEFYVSPFMEMEMRYDFTVTLPEEFQVLKINGHDQDGLLIRTSFASKRQELSDAALLARFLSHPLLSLKVVAGIHIEALILWLKGVRIVPRPAAPRHSVTIVK